MVSMWGEDVGVTRFFILQGGLRWLINKTKRAAKEKPNKTLESIIARSKRTAREVNQGIIVRLRYNTEKAFDVWSKSVEGVNGCFMQVLSLDVGVNDTRKCLTTRKWVLMS